MKQLLYTLNTKGVYHRLKEMLKPRLQRVVRAEFGAPGEKGPLAPDESDRLSNELYQYALAMGNDILNVRCRDAESSQEPDPHPDPFTYPDAVSVDGSEVGETRRRISPSLSLALARARALSGPRG